METRREKGKETVMHNVPKMVTPSIQRIGLGFLLTLFCIAPEGIYGTDLAHGNAGSSDRGCNCGALVNYEGLTRRWRFSVIGLRKMCNVAI